ncbi:MAG: molybdopterin-dependent oxidoreductase [Rhodocyclaceae bacterium]|nr:molybdopterin-dependent oxidoreductase [Rhodocyclaceae bacterium]
MNEIKSTCCYCGVGCGLILSVGEGRIAAVRGDPEHPANFGRLCTKGSTLHLATLPQTRALYPELRRTRSEGRVRISWDEALETAAERFAAIIREHGPEAVAFYVSGQLLTEDYYVFNKLVKGLIGTNNLDSNSRLCMSSAVAAYKQTLGSDAPPACYEDFDSADCLFIVGANTAFAHPVAFRRIEAAKKARPEMKIIVVDPRRTDTAEGADLFLPILPGTDIVLMNAMLNVMLWEGLIDGRFIREHTEGFEALREAVRETTPAVAAGVCGVPADDIITAARWFGQARAALSLWCQGLNQSAHGTGNGAALIHLHLATGQIGRPGAGPFSLTGQPNAMGGREVGAMANLASAHRNLADPEHRAEIARLWGVDSVPEKPGRTAVEIFEALRTGEIKAIWIACTNPAQSLPHQALVTDALEKAEFVVLQEAYRNTETADFADLLLPAATWGEKEGSMTNSERRISRVRPALPAPGETRADWAIARDFALALGEKLSRPEAARLFAYKQPEDIFLEHAASTRGRDLDISGLNYRILDEAGPQQWPWNSAVGGKARLYEDGTFPTASGKARFVPLAHKINAEATDARFPLHFNTGRLRDQWHGMSRTGKVARLFSHEEEARLDMHPEDLERRAIRDGDFARVKGRRGEIVLRVRAVEAMRRGQCFLAMHWGRRYLSHAGANAVTLPALDPTSKQPELKHAAVQVEKLLLPWRGLVLRSEVGTDGGGGDPAGKALLWMEAVQPLLARFRYAALALVGRERPALMLRLAHHEPVPAEWLEEIDACLELHESACLHYRDAKRGVDKKALIIDGVLSGVRLTGELAASDWLRDAVVSGQSAAPLRRWLLAPLSAPPSQAGPARGRVVCNCLDVTEDEILAQAGASLETVQDRLKCGTSCGSCLPEVKRLLTRGTANGNSFPPEPGDRR